MCKTLWILFLFAAATFTPSAHAENAQSCDSKTVEAVAHWAGIKGNLVSRNKQQGGLIAAAACTAMPNAPGTTIVAIAFDANPPDVDVIKDVEQVIALVKAGKVVAANRSVIREDTSIVVGGYRIDTARYLLSKDVRAFGVVFLNLGHKPRCADGGTGNELTLWIREGERLRAIFGASLSSWLNVEGNPCRGNVDNLRTEHTEMTIAVEKTSSHGFADLALTAHVTQYFFMGGGNRHAEMVVTKRTTGTVLKYDGQSYGFDMSLKFWYPAESEVKAER
jgi:hypothetical protein